MYVSFKNLTTIFIKFINIEYEYEYHSLMKEEIFKSYVMLPTTFCYNLSRVKEEIQKISSYLLLLSLFRSSDFDLLPKLPISDFNCDHEVGLCEQKIGKLVSRCQ
jgi:hypothetical protein